MAEEAVIEEAEVIEETPSTPLDGLDDNIVSEFNLDDFMGEYQEPPITKEQEEARQKEHEQAQEEQKQEEEAAGAFSGASQKQKKDQYKFVIEIVDQVMSFILVMFAQDPATNASEFQADDSYKDQMAEYMAMCDWKVELKPEWMLFLVALMAYGPLAFDAWKRRSAREKIKKSKKEEGTFEDGEIIHMVQDPKTGEYVEVSEEVFNQPSKTSSSNGQTKTTDQKKKLNECKVCGTLTKNKHYCSKACRGKGFAYEKAQKKRAQNEQATVV